MPGYTGCSTPIATARQRLLDLKKELEISVEDSPEEFSRLGFYSVPVLALREFGSRHLDPEYVVGFKLQEIKALVRNLANG